MRIKFFLIVGIILLGLIYFIGKRNNTLSKNDIVSGTYAGILPAADCPGIFRMLAIDSISYEQLDKYIEREGIFIEKGQITRKNNDIIIDNIRYHIGENIIYNQRDTLRKINNDNMLPKSLKQQRLIENRKGAEYGIIEKYNLDNKNKLDFFFLNKKYSMYLNEENSQVNEYTDGKNLLQLDIIDPAPEPVTTPIFYDGINHYEFSFVSPSYNAYQSTHGELYYDAVYFNIENQNLVMLLNTDFTKCYILPRTEVWAKGATYSNGKIHWTSSVNGAVLKIKNTDYKFSKITD